MRELREFRGNRTRAAPFVTESTEEGAGLVLVTGLARRYARAGICPIA